MIEPEGPISDVIPIPYDKDRITAIVRQILLTAPDRGRAVVRLAQMHSKLERGVNWTDGSNVKFHEDGSRTSRIQLSRGFDADPMTIDVRVTAEEIERKAS
jgi:hypothetical protein